jgi:hypothetical protein
MPYIRKTKDIFTSSEFDLVIEQIKDNSEVARLLLKKRHLIENLVDNHINYISISNSDKTKISYLTPERSKIIIDSSPYGEGSDELWSSSRRFHVKPGAFISKLFKDISPKEVENFSQLFRNVQTKITSTFKVVSGSDILNYYHYESYLSESGSLGSSCMKHDSCQDYLDLYVDNSDKISMLIMVDNNSKLIGRALLWSNDDVKIMDRIYTIDDESYQYHFKKWADDNGYWYKKEQKWNNTLFFESKGKTIYKEVSFELKSFEFNRYPYMDTFKFFDTNNGVISNYKPKTDNFKTLLSTEGTTCDHDYLHICEKSKLFYHRDEIINLDYLSMRVWSGLTVYSDVFDTHILSDDAIFDDSANDWIFKDDDLNNHVVLERARQDRSIVESQRLSSQNRWAELLSGGGGYESLENSIRLSLSDALSRAGRVIAPSEPPQEMEYTPS